MGRVPRILIASLAVVAATAVPSGAARLAPRVESQPYEFGGQAGGSVLGPIVSQAVFEGGPHRFAEFEVEDGSGQAVLAEIVQDDRIDTFCGATDEPIPIRPDFDVTIHLYAGRCVDGTPSIVTGGTVTARFLPGNPWAGDRSLDRPYSAAAPGPYFGFDPPLPGNAILTNVKVPVGQHRSISLEIEDASGAAVAASVLQGGSEIGRFCSSTAKRIPVRPWVAIEVYIHVGTCEDGTSSTPTSGVIKAVLQRSR